VGLQLSLEDFLRACLKCTVQLCRFDDARVSVRQCDVTETVTLSDRDRGVTVPRYKRGFSGNKDQLFMQKSVPSVVRERGAPVEVQFRHINHP
jgi:hypothetical protein